MSSTLSSDDEMKRSAPSSDRMAASPIHPDARRHGIEQVTRRACYGLDIDEVELSPVSVTVTLAAARLTVVGKCMRALVDRGHRRSIFRGNKFRSAGCNDDCVTIGLELDP